MNKYKIINLAFLAINKNETNDRLELRYRFSDPDGLKNGKSGYSFGASQFDIENNWNALWVLRRCGLTPKDLKRLYLQQDDISDLNNKLKENHGIIDAEDQKHIKEAYEHCRRLTIGIQLADNEVMIHIMDYHNQFYFSQDGKLHRALKAHGAIIDSSFILAFKLNHTFWGNKRPDDVERRFRNIHSIYKTNGGENV